jgi:protein translocase SecG subunit
MENAKGIMSVPDGRRIARRRSSLRPRRFSPSSKSKASHDRVGPGSILFYVLWVVFFVAGFLLAALVLLQESKGGGLAEAFGGIGAETFGTKTGGVNRVTFAVAGVFPARSDLDPRDLEHVKPPARREVGSLVFGMTGVGSARGQCELGPLAVEIRSVNGKGFSAKLRLPPELSGYEADLEGLVRERVRRGSMQVCIEVQEPSGGDALGCVDGQKAEAAARELELMRARLKLGGDVEIGHVLAVPGVLRGVAVPGRRLSSTLPPGARLLVTKALEELLRHRAEEGQAAADAMRLDLDTIDAELHAVRGRWPGLLDDHRRRLLERMNEFLSTRGASLEPKDLVREVALFADKVDVGEEIQRLASHVAKARSLLAGGGELGRALEFLLQEMLREINTLGSKVPDVAVAHAVVAMKLAIERLKEQAQNIE